MQIIEYIKGNKDIIKQVPNILRESLNDEYFNYDDDSIFFLINEYMKNGEKFYLLIKENCLIGIIETNSYNDNIYILSLCISKEYRSKGCSRILLNFVEKLNKYKYNEIYLECKEILIKYYESNGYKLTYEKRYIPTLCYCNFNNMNLKFLESNFEEYKQYYNGIKLVKKIEGYHLHLMKKKIKE
jgi:GNAT superfamily N-acetyltransferase